MTGFRLATFPVPRSPLRITVWQDGEWREVEARPVYGFYGGDGARWQAARVGKDHVYRVRMG